jgi:hypothetical protein
MVVQGLREHRLNARFLTARQAPRTEDFSGPVALPVSTISGDRLRKFLTYGDVVQIAQRVLQLLRATTFLRRRANFLPANTVEENSAP